MFKSIGTKSAFLLGLLSLSAMSMNADNATLTMDFAFVSKNDSCNFINLSPAQLQQKLQDPQETKKIIDFLVNPEFSDIITRNAEIYLQDIPDTQKIAFFFREDILSHKNNEEVLQISTDEFLANRRLLLNNKHIMQAIAHYYHKQIVDDSSYPTSFYKALMNDRNFRLSITNFFIDQIMYQDHYSQHFVNCLLNFTTQLVEQNDRESFTEIANALSRNSTKLDFTSLEILLNPAQKCFKLF